MSSQIVCISPTTPTGTCLGTNINRIRKREDILQSTLAHALRISISQLAKIESGIIDLKVELHPESFDILLKDIAAVLGCSTDDLQAKD